MIKRYPTKQIFVGNVPVGGDAPIPVQSMTFSKTSDVKATVEQITRLHFAGADIVRVAVPDLEAANALKEIKSQIDLPLVADIHFKYKLALIAAEVVDCIRINPGNIGDKSRVKEIVKACEQRNIPIRIGVNSGSLEKQFEDKYGQTPEGMVASAEYNIKYLLFNLVISKVITEVVCNDCKMKLIISLVVLSQVISRFVFIAFIDFRPQETKPDPKLIK